MTSPLLLAFFERQHYGPKTIANNSGWLSPTTPDIHRTCPPYTLNFHFLLWSLASHKVQALVGWECMFKPMPHLCSFDTQEVRVATACTPSFGRCRAFCTSPVSPRTLVAVIASRVYSVSPSSSNLNNSHSMSKAKLEVLYAGRKKVELYRNSLRGNPNHIYTPTTL